MIKKQSVFAVSQQIVLIHNRTSGICGSVLVRAKRQSLSLPVDQIGTDGMSPVHVFPFRSVRIALMVQMVDTIRIDQPTRIVAPACCHVKMQLRPERIDCLRFLRILKDPIQISLIIPDDLQFFIFIRRYIFVCIIIAVRNTKADRNFIDFLSIHVEVQKDFFFLGIYGEP
jgi:hypothetical protein